jgi:hypothetical protein
MNQRNDENRPSERAQSGSSSQQPEGESTDFHPGNHGFQESAHRPQGGYSAGSGEHRREDYPREYGTQRDREPYYGSYGEREQAAQWQGYGGGRSGYSGSAPDQYGQEHYWRDRPGQGRYGREHYGGAGRREDYGRDPYSRESFERGGDRSRFEPHRGGRSGYDPYQQGYEEMRGARGHSSSYEDWRRQQAEEPRRGFSHFSRSALDRPQFGQSEREPRYFGTGSQGYGGGPSFTGGAYGMADERLDEPYYEEGRGYRGESRYSGGIERSQGRSMRRYPRGPKGYQRSDERLREDISERLMHSDTIDSSDVTVNVMGGKVVLEGTVPDRYTKHAIEDLADAAPGVQDIENRIRVARYDQRSESVGQHSSGMSTGSGSAAAAGSTPGSGSTAGSAAGSGSSGSATSGRSGRRETQ